MNTPIHITAGAILLRGREILLARRSPQRRYYPGVWDIIGGHVEADETAQAALVRELNEELGIVPLRLQSIGGYDETDVAQQLIGQHHLFAVLEWQGVPVNRCPDEHAEIGWFRAEQLQTLPLASDSYPAIVAEVIARYGST
jgi:8-oxo-dGTP diphosphatase